MRTRPALTSVLVLTACLAAIAAPRLLPQARAAETPVPTAALATSSVEHEVVLPSVSELDERDAVAEAPAVADLTEPARRADPPARHRSRDIDLVIALDTSGSMEGLLDSARARLWDIVNKASEKDPNARVRVALVTFGSPGVAGPHEGFVKVRSDLTSDLDSLYSQVMALSTDGGEEFVGWTLHTAVSQLSWSSDPGAAKIIFVAGNESADQARESHDFRTVSAQAKEQGIVINSLFAGNAEQGVRERWASVAESGGGFYASIDQQAGTYQVATPHDRELMRLNEALNATYVGYGAKAEAGKRNQVAQDQNSVRMGSGSSASRVAVKSKSAYDNASWDLVDGVQKGTLDLGAAAPAALPEPLRELEASERQAYVEELAAKRAEIQEEIEQTDKKRRKYLKDNTADVEGGLDEAVMDALDEQL